VGLTPTPYLMPKVLGKSGDVPVLNVRTCVAYKKCENLPIYIYIYRVSQEECARLRESVSYVKLYRYNPKHIYTKLNGYGDNGQRSLKL